MIATYHCATASNIGAGTPHSGENYTAKATVANLLQHFEPILECQPIDHLGGPPTGQVVRYRHIDKDLKETFGPGWCLGLVIWPSRLLNRVLQLAD